MTNIKKNITMFIVNYIGIVNCLIFYLMCRVYTMSYGYNIFSYIVLNLVSSLDTYRFK